MHRFAVILLLFVAAAGAALAHQGKSHRLLGTVESVAEERLTVTRTDGSRATVALTPETRYEKDQKATDRSALVAGARVSIELTEDDRTAVKVKIGSGGRPGGGS